MKIVFESDLLKVFENKYGDLNPNKDDWKEINAYLERGYTIKAIMTHGTAGSNTIVLEKIR